MRSTSPKIILISGKSGSGKSTLARMLAERADAIPMKFAGPLYAIHEAIRGVTKLYDIPFDEKEGTLLQLLGTDWGRKIKGKDVWVNAAKKAVQAYGPRDLIVFDDCRFENELRAFPDAISIRLEAPESVRRERAESWRENTRHESETALDSARFDYVFNTAFYSTEEIVNTILEVL